MKDGKQIECYGLINESSKRVEGVMYEQETGNIVWSVFTMATIIVPVWLFGYKLHCPVKGQ